MVATAHEAASRAGAELLRAGGNAVDAAVGAAFVLAVVEPYSSGLGGGGFALVRMGDELQFLDFREVAPRKATREMFLRNGVPDPSLSQTGPLSVAVPGAVAGYLELHAKHGKLPRARVLQPAIRWANEGFKADLRYRHYATLRLEDLCRDKVTARIFLSVREGAEPRCEVPEVGARIVQPALSKTLRAIAAGGPKVFYEGEIARLVAADLGKRGGILDREDLRSYAVKYREPLVGRYRGRTVATAPLPSAGGQVLLLVLGIDDALPGDRPWHSADALHLFIESSKRAFADRVLLGDRDFAADPPQTLLQPERIAALAKSIGPRATEAAALRPGAFSSLESQSAPATPADGGPQTTHLSVVDAAGNAVSMTTTLNYSFGAAFVASGTGILMNDEMDDFALAPGVPNVYGVPGAEANAVQPGRRPLSSMTPTIVFEGDARSAVRLVVGSPGGPRIPTTVAQVVRNVLVSGMDVQQAVTAGRVHHQHLPDRVFFERHGLEPATVAELRARGHVLEEQAPWSNATAIEIHPGASLRTGAADPRWNGGVVAE